MTQAFNLAQLANNVNSSGQLSGSAITGAVANATNATNATNASSVPYSGLTGTVPTWNQNTTGNAATVTNGVYTTNFTNSLTSNGYQKLPNGLIIQWGTASFSAGSASITFPITFPNALFSITGCPEIIGFAGASYAATIEARSTSGATFNLYYTSGSPNVEWIAIGY